MDTTIKPLSGKQQGAAVSTNPKTPGRPSHHTPLMAGMRRVLGLQKHGQGYLFKLTTNVKRHIQR